MESKTFVNLPSSYRSFLFNVDTILQVHEINETSTLKKINSFYTDVHNILGNYEMQVSDINHILINYTRSNDTIDKLKQIVSMRNYTVISLGMKSSKWTNFINDLKCKYDITTKTAENNALRLFNLYTNTWNTIDKLIIMQNNKVRDIEIIDPEDFDYFCAKT
jgi:hypothetical protein